MRLSATPVSHYWSGDGESVEGNLTLFTYHLEEELEIEESHPINQVEEQEWCRKKTREYESSSKMSMWICPFLQDPDLHSS